MDQSTVQRLESLRDSVPRYLFRAWNNTLGEAPRVSGGHVGLNTQEAITPLAFFEGAGHSSVYNMSRRIFTNMVLSHLRTSSHMSTEFSSWASSLALVMGFLARGASSITGHGIHIGVIDTKQLWDSNAIYFVPDLDFLSPGRMACYIHQYLAHGVISGLAHRALPREVLMEGLGPHSLSLELSYPRIHAEGRGNTVGISPEEMRRAKQVGNRYGGEFTLPMCLAYLCRKKRDLMLFRNGVPDLEVIAHGVADLLPIPQAWETDAALKPDAKYIEGFGDLEQLYRLIRALLEHQKAQRIERTPVTSSAKQHNTDRKRKRDDTDGLPAGRGHQYGEEHGDEPLKKIKHDMEHLGTALGELHIGMHDGIKHSDFAAT